MNIYVASSWRNDVQPAIVAALRAAGHEVYDFRHPAPGNRGFTWSDIDPKWKEWTPEQYRRVFQHPIAEAGYALDIGALRACEAVVLVLPCGRSASWELGYAMGQGKPGYVVALDNTEPELMFREATILTSMDELFEAFGGGNTDHFSSPVPENRTCVTCAYRCMDMDMDPYCAAPEVRKRRPFGVSLSAVGAPAECRTGDVYALWKRDERGTP